MLNQLIIKPKKTVRTGIIKAHVAGGMATIDLGDGITQKADMQTTAAIGAKVTAVKSGGGLRVVSSGGIDSGNIKEVYING